MNQEAVTIEKMQHFPACLLGEALEEVQRGIRICGFDKQWQQRRRHSGRHTLAHPGKVLLCTLRVAKTRGTEIDWNGVGHSRNEGSIA